MKTRILYLLLAVLPFLSGCSTEDDIKGLIVGKTWRLVGFYDSNDNEIEFEDDEDVLDNNIDGFYIRFNQNNTFNGKGVDNAFSGTWSNETGNNFTMEIASESESEELDIALEYISAINGAYSCKGTDENVLIIKYNSSNGNRYMLFRVK